MQKTASARRWQEEFAQFFEAPSREKLRSLLQRHVGELNEYDFKSEWPAFSKVARHILGFANSGGGCLIMGVEERSDKTFAPVGLNVLQDKADIQKGIQKYIPVQIKYEALDFSFPASEYPELVGRNFQVLFIEDSPEYIPFVAKANGDGIRENTIYVRRGTSSVEANYEELQKIINRRLKTGCSTQNEFDLERHLAELRALYDSIPRYFDLFEQVKQTSNYGAVNPQYPLEDFEAFVKRIIEEKKRIVEGLALRM